MPWRIDQIKNILLPVVRFVHGADRLGLDRDAPLPLQIHVVKYLILHLTAGQQARHLNDAVRQRRFAVIDMCDNTKIPDSALV